MHKQFLLCIYFQIKLWAWCSYLEVLDCFIIEIIHVQYMNYLFNIHSFPWTEANLKFAAVTRVNLN